MEIPTSDELLRSIYPQFYLGRIQESIEEFERLLSFIVVNVKTEYDAIKKRYNEYGKHIPEGADNFEDDNYQIDEIFSKTLLNSYVVTLHSFAEAELTVICNFYSISNKACTPTFVKPKAGGVFDASKEYLMKEAKLDTKLFSQSEWCEIKKFAKIRNCIVHNEGRIPEKGYTDLTAYVQRNSQYINLSEQGQMILNDAYCKYITEQVLAFFNKLGEAKIKA